MDQCVSPKVDKSASPLIFHGHLDIIFNRSFLAASLCCKDHSGVNSGLDELRDEVLRLLIGDKKSTPDLLEPSSQIQNRLNVEARAIDARLARHVKLRLRFGVEARVEAEDRQHLCVGARVLGGPREHMIVVHA